MSRLPSVVTGQSRWCVWWLVSQTKKKKGCQRDVPFLPFEMPIKSRNSLTMACRMNVSRVLPLHAGASRGWDCVDLQVSRSRPDRGPFLCLCVCSDVGCFVELETIRQIPSPDRSGRPRRRKGRKRLLRQAHGWQLR